MMLSMVETNYESCLITLHHLYIIKVFWCTKANTVLMKYKLIEIQGSTSS